MSKMCVLDINKVCNNCGECDKCDLNPNKICNNCGKCLNVDNFDTRSIMIDDIIEDKKAADEFESETEESVNSSEEAVLLNDYDDDYISDNPENEVEYELIDDIEGLSEILEDEAKREKYASEVFPGMFSINKLDK